MRYNPKRHRLPAFENSGLILVDKPQEWTSFDVVNCLRGRFNIPKLGHCGTLDPLASGLLILVAGEFTKLASKLSSEDKVYHTVMKLGLTTDSQDITGAVTAERDYSEVTPEQVKAELLALLGKSQQLPPMVSAVKKDGKRLYELARKGIEVERELRDIEILDLEILRIELPEIEFVVKCSKGTYVRTLCHDVGEKLGCGAVLTKLIRTECGDFKLTQALDMDKLKEMTQEELSDWVHEFLTQNLAELRGIHER